MGVALPLWNARFKAETRFWDYRLNPSNQDEPTNSSSDDMIGHLEEIGIIAHKGSAEAHLEAIIHNLEASNDLHIDAHCRVLLFTKLELFTVGHTIVVSRGLLDVVPNEASLAYIVALGLARIASQTTDAPTPAASPTPKARDLFLKVSFASPRNLQAKLIELGMRYFERSPYKDSRSSVQEFLGEISAKSPYIPELLTANLGDSVGAYSGNPAITIQMTNHHGSTGP